MGRELRIMDCRNKNFRINSEIFSNGIVNKKVFIYY